LFLENVVSCEADAEEDLISTRNNTWVWCGLKVDCWRHTW